MDSFARIFTGPKSRWFTLLAWIALAAILTVTLPSVKAHEKNNAANLPADASSVIAAQVIAEQFPQAAGIPALIVWQRDEGLLPEDYKLIADWTAQLEQSNLPELLQYAPLHRMPIEALYSMTSSDGSVLIQALLFEEDIRTEVLKSHLEQIKQGAETIATFNPFGAAIDNSGALTARISGPAGILVDATDLFKNADFVLLMATVLLVLVLLLAIYRSPILAIIPLVGVGFAYLVISPILGWLAANEWIIIDSQATAIMTVLLFGAGTDYCLFFITRFRQELTLSSDTRSAMKRTFSGASGAIAMSGLTVVLALITLLAAQYGSYHRFAIPFSLAILIMAAASLTLIPAVLAIIGRNAFFPFIPRTSEMEQARAVRKGRTYTPRDPERQFGSRIGNLVVSRPWTVTLVSTLALGALALFAIGIPYKYDLLSSFPEDMPSRQGYAQITEAFEPGDLAPVTLVIRADASDADVRYAVTERLQEIPHIGTISEPEPGAQSSEFTAYTINLDVNPYETTAMDTIPLIRQAAQTALEAHDVAPAADHIWIGGQTADQYDQRYYTERDMRVVMPLVILLIALLLLVYLRSVVATIYLLATVLLSFVAALGLGWLILHYVLGIEAIQAAIPLYAFVFLIALGEDYNIFMISGIWKKSREMPLRQAIKEGVSQTGSVITSAGLILAATFAVLASLPLQVLMQFGLITALGVLLDTFVVRPFLVPALTALLGKTAFWPGKVHFEQNKKRAQ